MCHSTMWSSRGQRKPTLTHSTSDVQGAVALGGPDLLMLTTAKPVCKASSHTLVPTNPLPPKTISLGGPSYVLCRAFEEVVQPRDDMQGGHV